MCPKRPTRRKKFYTYVIQIGSTPEVLYVNFATDTSQAFQKFLHRHTHIRNSVLRTDLFTDTSFKTSKLANRACVRLIQRLETKGYEIIAGGPLHNKFWQLYVIQINGDPKHLYVGETNYPVEKRFQQHIYKFNPARILLKYNNFELAMHHTQGWLTSVTKQESLKNETALASQLKSQGFKVEGGH